MITINPNDLYNQPEEYSNEKKVVGDFWMVRTGGIFYDKVKILKIGWFRIKVETEKGTIKNLSKVDFVRKA